MRKIMMGQTQVSSCSKNGEVNRHSKVCWYYKNWSWKLGTGWKYLHPIACKKIREYSIFFNITSDRDTRTDAMSYLAGNPWLEQKSELGI